jgi:hypothetical protein
VNGLSEKSHGMRATFDSALRGLRMTGASVDTRALVDLIAKHGTEEGRLLSTYEGLVDTAPDEGVRYLIGLILEDERRHHRLLAEIANSMAWGSIAGSPEDSTPDLPHALTGELLEQTRRLRKAEQTDYRELRRIRPAPDPAPVATVRRDHPVGADRRPHAGRHQEARHHPPLPRAARAVPLTVPARAG